MKNLDGLWPNASLVVRKFSRMSTKYNVLWTITSCPPTVWTVSAIQQHIKKFFTSNIVSYPNKCIKLLLFSFVNYSLVWFGLSLYHTTESGRPNLVDQTAELNGRIWPDSWILKYYNSYLLCISTSERINIRKWLLNQPQSKLGQTCIYRRLSRCK